MLVATVVAALLQILDIHSTLKFLDKGYTEANPVIRWAMEKMGWGWIVFKLLLACVGIYLIFQTGYTVAMVFVCVFYSVIVARNYKIASR